jgi:hypothetical protein
MSLVPIADRVYVQRHPLNLLGCRMGRVVTILQLESGRTLIHTTAGFSTRKIGCLDFERIIFGHGDPIVKDARSIFRKVLLDS